jgi:hypothetical protein
MTLPKYQPFAAAVAWPAETPLKMLEPAEHGDDLDGVTREQLVAAQIAKHKEMLAPNPVLMNKNVTAEKFLTEQP